MKNEIIKLRNEGKTYNEIRKILGCSKSTISYHCSKLKNNEKNIEKNINIKNLLSGSNKFKTSKENINEIIKLRKNKKTYNEISKEVNISINIVRKVCRVLNLTTSRKFGKISKETISKVKKLYKKNYSSYEISKKLKISKTTVLKYVDSRKRKKMSDEERKKRNVKSVINWRKRKKSELVEYKGGKCEVCKYNKCIDALEFHHIDSTKKDFQISGKSWSYERLKKEVDKCILVCSNCHKEIHHKMNKRL